MFREKVVALVGAAHAESLKTMEALVEEKGTTFLLYGNKEEILHKAHMLDVCVEEQYIIDAQDDQEASRLAAQAAYDGIVHVLMKGSVHTADFLRAILHPSLALLPKDALLSHVAMLKLPWYHKILLLTDAAVSIFPNIDTKVQIIINAITTARNLGIERPKVALVTPVETVNPKIVSTTDASQIVFLHKNTEIFGLACVEGPFGFDVALSKEAAMIKGISGEVPGDADILVFGNIDAANTTFKALQSVPTVQSAGIVVGAKIPIVLTSRSESKQTRLASIQLALEVSG